MAHLGDAPGDGVEDLERGHQFPGPVHLDLDTAPAHLADERGEPIDAGAQGREVLGPGGNQLPLISGRGPDGPHTGGAGAERQGGGPGLFEEIATLHVLYPRYPIARCELI